MQLITCENVSLGYEGNVVVSELSFSVSEGDYLCIVGENGSGKSTLMRGLIGLKEPLAGEIRFADSLRPTEIGYLPQQTVVQRDFPASVYEIVLSGCRNQGRWRPFYTKAQHGYARSQMERLGIWELKSRCYRELSGGQQQRTLLARALCATRKLLLLDEPMAGLDPVVTAELYDCIGALNREDRITVIMVSHDMHSVTHNATHVLHIGKAGELFYGTADAYRESALGQAFLRLCKCPDHEHHGHAEEGGSHAHIS